MSDLIFLKDIKYPNYKQLGMKCGIETHQQLNCGKLFSPRPCEIVPNNDLDKEIFRSLRFSLSETGEKDKAAEHEFKKNKTNIYRYNDECASLVDLDEEPPSTPNPDAIKTALQLSMMFHISFFDAIQFMRKLIIDGSVTSGFQRTALLGTSGYLETSFGEVGINAVNIEEDSCRVIERNHKQSIFSLDRQGIPLIEITTSPDAKNPEQVEELASTLGSILRSFPTTKRGLGTIRQDLNISIAKGARTEIKGAQNLRLVKEVVESEVKRQQIQASIIDEIKRRNISLNSVENSEINNVTSIFLKSESKVIRKHLDELKHEVFAVKLEGFSGILGHELQENYRFATEIAAKNTHQFPEIKGMFHSDELPKYKISEEEVSSLKKTLRCDEKDAFVMILHNKNYARESLEYIKKLIVEHSSKVPSEVRQVDPKGTRTIFLRPMPGSARMYPETDIPLINLDEFDMNKLFETLPELYDKKLSRLSEEFSLDEKRTNELLSFFNENEIKELLKESDKKAQDLYSIVVDIPKDIKKREGIEPISFSYSLFKDLLSLSSSKNLDQKY